MRIEGIENLSEVKYAKPIVGFIIDQYDEDVIITEVDPHIFKINDDTYAIYHSSHEYELMDEHNQNIFEGLVTEVPLGWREYIDDNKWIAENGIDDFVDYLEDVLYEYPSVNYVTSVDSYNIYELC